MHYNEHTSISELLTSIPECREFFYPLCLGKATCCTISELSATGNIPLPVLLTGIDRYVKRARQNPCNYSQMREMLIKPGAVNIAGFVNFLWQEPFVLELKAKAEELGVALNINIFPGHLKKQFQNYLAVCGNPDDLPEILIGKGFSSLMTSRFVDIFVKPGYYKYAMSGTAMSNFFVSKGYTDSGQSYHPFGVEELVMVYDDSCSEAVNHPQSWEDLLKPAYLGMLSQTGKEHRDHFGFMMMLYLYKSLGEEGIIRYAGNVKIKQHFTHTIKNIGKKNDKSAPVNIMHQFAARFIRSDAREQTQIVDARDGNPSVCHFCMLKQTAEEQAVEIAKHLYSEPIKNIIEKGGTTHISSPKPISGNNSIRWIGWDTLRELPLPYLKEYLSEIAYNHFNQ